jgi:transposase-like protein
MCKCKKCFSAEVFENGFVRSKQRYKCKKCGYNFTEGDTRTARAKPTSLKNQAIQLYLLDLGFRAIGRFLDVSNVSVLKWVRQHAAKQELSLDLKEEIAVMELDEMWHYCQKKAKNMALVGDLS